MFDRNLYQTIIKELQAKGIDREQLILEVTTLMANEAASLADSIWAVFTDEHMPEEPYGDLVEMFDVAILATMQQINKVEIVEQ